MLMTLADTIRNVGFLVVILWHGVASFGRLAPAAESTNASGPVSTRFCQSLVTGLGQLNRVDVSFGARTGTERAHLSVRPIGYPTSPDFTQPSPQPATSLAQSHRCGL